MAFEAQLPFAHLVEKIHQEDITRTLIDRHNIITNSTLSSPIKNFSMDIDNLTVDDVGTTEQEIAYGINVVQHKYSNDPYFKEKPLFLKKFRIKCSRSGHSISTCAEKRYTKRSEASNFQKII